MLVQAAVLLIVSRLGAIDTVTFPDLLEPDDDEHEITAEVGSFTYRHGDRVVVRWKSAKTPKIERGQIIEEATGISEDILDFLEDRLKVQQREAGVRHDLIDAVFALGDEDDLVRLARAREGAAGVRRHCRRGRPADRLQARREHPPEGEVGGAARTAVE